MAIYSDSFLLIFTHVGPPYKINRRTHLLNDLEYLTITVLSTSERYFTNRYFQFFRTLTAYPIEYRLLLTGTPLQVNIIRAYFE